MSRQTIVLFLAGAIGLICLTLAGCSDDSTSAVAPDSGGEDYAVAYYFPVSEGYTTTYQVSYSDGSSETVTYEIGEEVSFGILPAREWAITDGSGNIDVGFCVLEDSAVYYFENTRSLGEKILALPLSPGASWDRYSSSTGDDSTSSSTYYDVTWPDKFGGQDGGQEPTGDDDEQPFVQKSYPTSGSNEVVVEAIENVQVNGQVIGGAARVKTSGSVGKANYYWYAPGIGLVKYVLGADIGEYDQGAEVGELLAHGVH